MPSYIRTRTEFAVNSFTAANQTAPSVSTFADGGFVVVWGTLDPTQDGSESAIKAQLFDASGAKVGPEFLINAAGAGHQFTAEVETLANGSFVVSWVTLSLDGAYSIKAQMFGRDGSAISGEFQVNPANSGGNFTPNIAPLANGGFVISWDDSSRDVKAQIFDSAGARVGGAFTLNTKTDYAQEYGDITPLAGGGFVSTWRTTDSTADGSSDAVKAQIFDATGAKVGAEFLVNSQKAGFQYSPSLTSLSGGGFVVTWYTTDSAQDGSEGAIKAQLFSASGAKVGTEFLVNGQAAGTQHEPVVTALNDGGFMIAWVNLNSAGDGSGSAIKAQAFDSAGAKVGGEMLVNTLATGAQFLPDMATLADGRVIVAWTSESGDISGYSVRAQILGTELAAPIPNTRPIIISNGGGTSASLTLDEGQTAVTTVVASDDGEPLNLRYSITGGADAALFTINALTGALAFRQAPDAEAPQDQGGDNFYNVTVAASDGQLSGFQSVQISIRHVNQVTIVSDGGYDYANVSVDENQTGVTTVTAFDNDGLPLSYAITGGEDAAFFTIDPQTGQLSFTAAPDYESPQDVYGDNVYFVDVTASDGTVSDTQQIAVYVGDVEESGGFAIISDGGGDEAFVEVPENSVAVTTVAVAGAAGAVTYEIVGGEDSWQFVIDPQTGVLEFMYPADFDYANDYDLDNVYEVTVRASDGSSYDDQYVSVILANVDEAPIFYSYWGAADVALNMLENSSRVGDVFAYDSDMYAWVTYGIEGGADAALFYVDPYNGSLGFIDGFQPDFEAPADADGDNVYEVTIVAYSGSMLTATQSFSITIEDEDEYEAVAITSDGGGDDAFFWVPENSTAVTLVAAAAAGPVTYEIVGGADASAFTIDSATGELAFAVSPNFEWTVDSDHDNVFEVTVRASDGISFDDQTLSVNLTDVDEDPDFFDHEPGVIEIWAGENSPYAGILNAYDIDGGPAITYSVTGGADGALFVIDPVSGELSFADGEGPDFEAPADADGDNHYEVEVTATAGTWSRARDFTVTVVDEDEPLVITSNGGGTSAAIAMDEGDSYVTTVVGLDPDGNAPSYSIVGGPDSARFAIDAATGVLSFVETPDYEAPADSVGANFYTVQVAASDGLHSTWQTIQVLIGNVNEGLDIISYGGADISIQIIPENVQPGARVEAVDRDGDTLTYSISGGADAALFAIDSATGLVSFIAPPDYEAPADEDGDNDYIVEVTASDGEFSASQILCFGITDANEPVAIVSNGGGNSAAVTIVENGRNVATVAAADPDGAPLTYAIAGGADAARFTIDAVTGALAFVTAPNFEAPADSGANNVYDVIVSASDGSFTDTQALAVTVGNVNEAPVITSNGGGASAVVAVGENGRAVTTVAASDPEGTAAAYSIVGGADAARFTIDPQTGLLQFVVAPDYELPGDADGDNVYSVTVKAGDGQLTDVQSLSVTVGNLRDGNVVTGTGGNDSISGTSSNLALRTSNEEDNVSGGGGHDTILGLGGDDYLSGDAGNDDLTGGAGADRLTGGLGKDQFVYTAVSDSTPGARDLITDFSRAQADKINLSAIDANANLVNNQAFAFIGSAAFSHVAGQLRFEQVGGNTFVSGDVNGDGAADFQIELTGTITPVASDFVL